MNKAHLISIIIVLFFTPYLWASDQSYNSYNNIVSELHNQLKAKKETTVELLKNSSYSLAAGLNSQLHKVNDESTTSAGLGAEVGIYNFLVMPLKLGLIYSSGSDLKEVTALAKTDISFFKHNLFDVKLGLAAGISSYTLSDSNFTSLFISPSAAVFYQINKTFDTSFNIEYLFHNSNKVSNHFNPSVNLITYF